MAGAEKALLPLLLIAGGVGVAMAVSKGGSSDEGDAPDDGVSPLVPGKPVLPGGQVVSRGFKTTGGGVRVTFQVERVADEPAPEGQFFGVIFQPWEANAPETVSQATTRKDAVSATAAFIAADAHGA